MITRGRAYKIAKQEVPSLEQRKWHALREESGENIIAYPAVPRGTAVWLVSYSPEDKRSDSNIISSSMGLAINKTDGRVLFHGLITDEG